MIVSQDANKKIDVSRISFRVIKTQGFTVEIGIRNRDYILHFYLRDKSINPAMVIQMFIATLQPVIPNWIHVNIDWFSELNSYALEFKNVATLPNMDRLIEGRAIEALKGVFR